MIRDGPTSFLQLFLQVRLGEQVPLDL